MAAATWFDWLLLGLNLLTYILGHARGHQKGFKLGLSLPPPQDDEQPITKR